MKPMSRDEIVSQLDRVNSNINNVPGNPASLQNGKFHIEIGGLNTAEMNELVSVVGKWHWQVVKDKAAPLELEKKELEKALLDSFIEK